MILASVLLALASGVGVWPIILILLVIMFATEKAKDNLDKK